MSPDILQKNTDEKEKQVNYDRFIQAWQPFSGDLGLVHKENELKTQSPFDPPLPNSQDNKAIHNYNLTVIEDPNHERESEIKAKLAKIKTVVVGCMDWRFANQAYKHALDEGYKPEEIMLITVGGGAIQHGKERIEGLKDILSYVVSNSPLAESLFMTGHMDRCGALAHWTQAEPGTIHQNVGNEIGGDEERTTTKSLISWGRKHLVPDKHQLKINTHLYRYKGFNSKTGQIEVETEHIHPDHPHKSVSELIQSE